MILNKIDDPRDNLEKARRYELATFAMAHGVSEISYEMPAILMRRILRSKGLTNVRIPPRVLGQQNQPNAMPQPGPDAKIVEVDAGDDLARQYRRPERTRRLVEKPKTEINALRDECKRLGIKMARTDRMPDLKAKLEAHRGKDTAQFRQ